MASLQGYGLSREELEKLQVTLASFVESRITHHVQEAANTAMSRMKERSARSPLLLWTGISG